MAKDELQTNLDLLEWGASLSERPPRPGQDSPFYLRHGRPGPVTFQLALAEVNGLSVKE